MRAKRHSPGTMALEVQPTPKLEGDTAVAFLKKLAEDSVRRVTLVETPNISQVLERVRADAAKKRGH